MKNDSERFDENQEKRVEKAIPARILDPREPIERVNPFSADSAEKFAREIKDEKRET